MQDNNLDYVSQVDAGKQLNVSRSAISAAIKRGLLATHTVAGRKVLTQAEIDRYKRERLPQGWAGYHKRLNSLKKKNIKK